jgi:hypothetical protein
MFLPVGTGTTNDVSQDSCPPGSRFEHETSRLRTESATHSSVTFAYCLNKISNETCICECQLAAEC